MATAKFYGGPQDGLEMQVAFDPPSHIDIMYPYDEEGDPQDLIIDVYVYSSGSQEFRYEYFGSERTIDA